MVQESRARNCEDDIVHPSVSMCLRAIPVEDEVENLAHQVNEMEVVLAKFQGVNVSLCHNMISLEDHLGGVYSCLDSAVRLVHP
ncbi:putative mitochondrial-processing peptidase subunit beta [Dorcoceras hygrometricum]|uniref:Putative mitochondrial-processing peptidase subunit beta n=1 Tax=Dorcoceras hygrometricum TaxID=472368 RepID=A0A2Z7BYB2_9LAMI|nr:putative mitochondrial-processing peptidase subunit beta [Dorcoceras hygrometricum]